MPAISRNGKFLTKTKTQGDIGGVSSVRLYEKQLGSQGASSYTVFTLSGSYVPGSNTLNIFVNGQKVERVVSGASDATQYIETSAKVITFGSSLQVDDVIEFIIYGSYPVNNRAWNTNSYEYTMTSSGTQVVLPFNPNTLISIYVDGIRQQSDAYSLSGSTVTFTETLPSGTKLLFVSPNTDDIPLTNADTLDGYHASQLIGRKNFLINGAMDIWQRGTSFSNITSAVAFLGDRFYYNSSSDATINLDRSTSIPTVTQAGCKLNYSSQVSIVTADTSIASNQVAHITQKIEGYNFKHLVGKTVTLSFWVYSNKTGIYCVAFRSGSDNCCIIKEYTISSANTWEKQIITITMHDTSAGTWDFTSGTGLKLSWCLACGTNFQTVANTWQLSHYFATSNQVNFLDNTSNIFRMTAVQLEIGSSATDFEYRPIHEELQACQRYYEKSYAPSDAPGTSTATNSRSCIPIAGALTRFYLLGNTYVVPKRTTPTTLTLYSQDGTSGSISVYNNSATKISISSIGSQGESQIATYFQSGSSGTSGELYIYHYTADAEL